VKIGLVTGNKSPCSRSHYFDYISFSDTIFRDFHGQKNANLIINYPQNGRSKIHYKTIPNVDDMLASMPRQAHVSEVLGAG
jgi:hypothetical protein